MDDPKENDNPAVRRLNSTDYDVGWICALPLEVAAACAMFDSRHEDLLIESSDTNTYYYGRIWNHNVVVAGLGRYGTNSAAHTISNMNRTFPQLRVRFLVGIGGGVPSQVEDFDMRLGDVVVGQQIIQYDQGKVLTGGRADRTPLRDFPPSRILSAVAALRARLEMSESRILEISADSLMKNVGMKGRYTLPQSAQDQLFEADYNHPGGSTCDACDTRRVVCRPERSSVEPEIHYGTIASGNQVIKDGQERDRLAQELNAVCFEMEAAGLLRQTEFLVIRGICDYADSHKNKAWQRHAALMAAAYAKELLDVVPLTNVSIDDEKLEAGKRAAKRVSEHRKRLMDLISFSGIGSREEEVRPAYRSTCQWILQHPDYLRWMDRESASENFGLFWISGKPGSGKSTMMKFLWESEKDSASSTSSICLSFFFYARGAELQRNTQGMYRSLLHQLLKTRPELQSVLDTTTHQDGTLSTSILRKLLKVAVLNITLVEAIMYIDAVDECREDEVRDMVDFFEDLSVHAKEKDTRLRICFSSRHYPHVHLRRGTKMTIESQPGHERDMEAYLDSRVLFNVERTFGDVRMQLLKKASGVFLWIVLVTDILNKVYQEGSMFDVEGTVDQLPSELLDLFRRIVNRDSESMERFQLSVQWLLYAQRPLTLEEFVHGVYSGLPSATARSMFKINMDDGDMRRFVTSSGKGLIECYEGYEFARNTGWVAPLSRVGVRFIHESVRDFLIVRQGLAEVWPELASGTTEKGHKALLTCCQNYMEMLQENLSAGPLNTTKTSREDLCVRTNAEAISRNLHTLLRDGKVPITRGDAPLLEYLASYIHLHANLIGDQDCQREFLENLNFDVSGLRYDEIEKWQFYRPPNEHKMQALTLPQIPTVGRKFHLMLAIAHFNAPDLLRCKYFEHMELNCVDSATGDHPLRIALRNGHSDLVRALLELNQGIPEHCLNFDYISDLRDDFAGDAVRQGGRKGPLEWAVAHGNTDLAHCFIANGANVNCSGDGISLLRLATKQGHITTVTMLLDQGLGVNHLEDKGLIPLTSAVEIGDEQMVRILMQRGAQASACPIGWANPLHYAAFASSKSMVKLLLDTDERLNVGTATELNNIALKLVCSRDAGPRKEIAQLLINRGSAAGLEFAFGDEIVQYGSLSWDDDFDTVVAKGEHGVMTIAKTDWVWELD